MHHSKRILSKLHPRNIPKVIDLLMQDEAISAKFIIGGTILALILANTPLFQAYEAFWATHFSLGLGDWSIDQSLRHWVNEGLMTFFFLVVGLEIKRELVNGELKNPRVALLPIAAALGGMIVPAFLYILLNAHGPAVHGWAIPMATDIAFAVGALAILGSRIPSALKLFLLTLAIVDDIGAIVVIAVFYGTGFHPLFLAAAAFCALILYKLQRYRKLSITTFILLGCLLWISLYEAGIHASIAGAILGLLAPVREGRQKHISDKIERHVVPFLTLIVVPVFAFANTGISLSLQGFNTTSLQIIGGVALGLIVGKVVGVVGGAWIVTKLKLAQLPSGVRWPHIIGVGSLAGIGFTVSIFVVELAFVGDEASIHAAKIAILGASVISAAIGLIVLRKTTA